MDAASDQLAKRLPVIARIRSSALFRRDNPLTTTTAVIGWWESRRIPFNLIVGSAGIASCMVCLIVGAASWIFFQSDFGLPDPPIFGVIAAFAYGFMANVCFTGGWLIELLIRHIWPVESDQFAISSFSLGVIFSVLLTLTPGILVTTEGLFLLIRHFLRVSH